MQTRRFSNNVDLSDNDVDLSDNDVDFSENDVDLSDLKTIANLKLC